MTASTAGRVRANVAVSQMIREARTIAATRNELAGTLFAAEVDAHLRRAWVEAYERALLWGDAP